MSKGIDVLEVMNRAKSVLATHRVYQYTTDHMEEAHEVVSELIDAVDYFFSSDNPKRYMWLQIALCRVRGPM
jgi:hypothetical protein